ncbi:MAG: hypothetical protein M1818_002537 [Claussenomyces sp. TS43310]|nr:MAG: hypothetical protein M1818_002537 [Claussenomyces sp. TS43310]
MAEFIASPCAASDAAAMADIYMRAFGPNPIEHAMFPPTSCPAATLREWLIRRFTTALTTQREMHLVKLTDAATGGMVAFARWTVPHTLTPEEKAARAQKQADDDADDSGGFPSGANVEACRAFFGALRAMEDKYVVDDDMYVMHLLATHPDYQRRGLARTLLAKFLACADAEGRRAYIEATPAGHALYASLGWRDVDEIVVDVTKWGGAEPYVNWVMVREPQKKDAV